MNEIAIRPVGTPSEHEMAVFNTMASCAVSSKMYKGIGDESGIMMIMLAARELGIPAMQALNGGLNIIQGKVEISARMMNALIRKSGHQIQIKEISDNQCVLVGRRLDTGETQESSFSVVDAQRAGLVKPGGGWTKFPKDMCYARALSRLARQLFSDVIGIGYVEGEIKALEAETSPIDIPEDEMPEKQSIWPDEQDVDVLYEMIPSEDRDLFTEYKLVVMKHFGWTQKECVKKFLSEKNLLDKFNAWKTKRKKDEEITTV